MFIVATDLSEAQRERLTSSLSLRNMTVTANTLDSVHTVFVESFCSPESSIENPSLRVSGHGSSTSRPPSSKTMLMNMDKRLPTGEQGFFDDERSCFFTWDDNEHAWHFKIVTLKEEKAKEKAKVDWGRLKSIGNAYLGEEQTQDTEWWSEEDSVWWSKGKEGKKDSSKGKNNLPESDSRTYHQKKGTDDEHHSYKGRGKDQKRKRKESSYC